MDCKKICAIYKIKCQVHVAVLAEVLAAQAFPKKGVQVVAAQVVAAAQAVAAVQAVASRKCALQSRQRRLRRQSRQN